MNITEQLPPAVAQGEAPHTLVGAGLIWLLEPISILAYTILDALFRENLRGDGIDSGETIFTPFISLSFFACVVTVPTAQRGRAQKSFENTLRRIGLMDIGIVAVLTADEHWHTVAGTGEFDKFFLAPAAIEACKKYSVIMQRGHFAAESMKRIIAALKAMDGENHESK